MHTSPNAEISAGRPAPDRPPTSAILFDLLTALVDSWSLWNRAAGSDTDGKRWRHRYLALTYAAGNYRPYDALVEESAVSAGLPVAAAHTLLEQWDTLEPWPEARGILRLLGATCRIGVVTNCSAALAERAVKRLGYDVDVVVSAEQAGAYKPDPRPYRLALEALQLPGERVLFVAGSPFDIPGAGGVGMPVVWHNRLSLSLPEGIAAPLAELETLHALPAVVAARR